MTFALNKSFYFELKSSIKDQQIRDLIEMTAILLISDIMTEVNR